MTRAADRAAGLAVTVLGVIDETLGTDSLVGQLSDGLLLCALQRGPGIVGLCALDLELRSALIEMQTMRRLAAAAATPRVATAADLSLCRPLIDALLSGLSGAAPGTDLAGWADGAVSGPAWPDLRAVALQLPDASYRAIRLSLDLGAGERTGELILALPQKVAAPAKAEITRPGWSDSLVSAVGAAPAELVAILHRLRLPLAEIEGFAVGQVLRLDGTSISAVRLETLSGRAVATARLGQVGGMRAVRISTPPPPVMQEVQPQATLPTLAAGPPQTKAYDPE
jgi:flagellar motor switch protein FliM